MAEPASLYRLRTHRTGRWLRGLTAALGCAVLAGCEAPREADNAGPNFELLGPCARPDDGRYTYLYEDALCGSIPVHEDRIAASGRRIDLNVMVLPASGSVRRDEPVFFLAGGPGQAATDDGAMIAARLSGISSRHDFVFVDQRGTGRSNSLACDLDEDAMETLGSSLDEVTRLQQDQLRECLTGLDADPALYTTPIAMDDLNEVRERLGYDAIHLLGISYGTRAGLVYLRRHGDTVRSAIFDGVAPLSMSIPANVAGDAAGAWQLVLQDCAANVACAARYPDLDNRLRSLLDRLQSPDNVELIHPRTGESFQTPIESAMVTRLIRAVLYSRQLSSLLPLVVTQAEAGDYQPLVTLAYSLTGEDMKMSLGMMASVLCAEDMRRGDPLVEDATFDNPIFETLLPICEFWPTGEVPDAYFEPVASDIPTLLFSGALDPITPPKYGEEAAATLSNGRHIVVPGIGHNTIFAGCIPELLEQFLEDPKPAALDSSCVGNISRPHFFTGFAGPSAEPVE